MNPIEIDRNSWHWKLIAKFGDINWWDFDQRTISACEYARELVKALFLLSLMIVVGGGAVASVFLTLVDIFFPLEELFGWNESPVKLVTGLGWFMIAMTGAGIVWAVYAHVHYVVVKPWLVRRKIARANKMVEEAKHLEMSVGEYERMLMERSWYGVALKTIESWATATCVPVKLKPLNREKTDETES